MKHCSAHALIGFGKVANCGVSRSPLTITSGPCQHFCLLVNKAGTLEFAAE